MTNAISVGKLQAKSHDSPDETRTPSKTRIEIVRLEGFTIGRFSFEPGWRWSECVKPVAGTDSCQASHVGYAVQGQITVRLGDGSQRSIKAGDSYTIPPGHDAWVDGKRGVRWYRGHECGAVRQATGLSTCTLDPLKDPPPG